MMGGFIVIGMTYNKSIFDIIPLILIIPRKLNVRCTFMVEPREPRQEDRPHC